MEGRKEKLKMWREEFEEIVRQFKEPLRVKKKGSEREDNLEIC